MSDNLFALLQSAHAVARTSDASIYGVEIAIVTNVKDPQRLGRVKVCFPRMPGKPESDWARIAQPAAGPGRGFYWLPHVQDEVLVAFERGAAHLPFVIGSLWNGKDQPMKDAVTDENTRVMLQSRSGHQVLLDDKDGEEMIVIADKSGKRAIIFDVKAQKLVIEATEGDLVLSAGSKIVITCEDLEIKTAKTSKIDIGTKFDLTVTGKAQIKAGPRLDMTASKIEINPSSGGGGGGAQGAAGTSRSAVAKGKGGSAGRGGGAGATSARGGGDLGSDVVSPKPKAAAPAPAAAAASAAQPAKDVASEADSTTAADELDLQLVSVAGTPRRNAEVELTFPDGTKQAGKTDDKGHFKLSGLSAKGNAKLDVPDVEVAPAVAASSPNRLRFVKGGIDVPVGKASVVEVPTGVRRCRMKGMHFDTGKTFLLPSAMVGIRQLVKLFESFEGLTGLVTGHTDRQGRGGADASTVAGAVEFNRDLSNERAAILKAFLLEQAETWTPSYAPSSRFRPWGVLEDQQMLSTVAPKGSDTPFLSPPESDGLLGPHTSAAYKAFQSSRLLPETGKPDSATRLDLVRAYMALERTSLDAKTPLETHGCGLAHPTPETEGDPSLSPEERAKAKPDQPVNRRVEIFLFEEKIDPLPQKPCPVEGCAEYAKWVDQKILDVDLDAPPGAARVTVVDGGGQPVAGAHVHLAGPLVLDATAGSDGVAQFDDLIAGDYTAIADAEGFLAADAKVSVPSGAAGAATLTLEPEGFDLQVLVVDDQAAASPIPAAQVSVDAQGIAAQTAGDDGIARFTKLPAGKVHLVATHKGFVKGEADVVLARGAPVAAKQSIAAGKNAQPAKPAATQKTVVLTTRTLTVKLLMMFASPDKPAEARFVGTHPVNGATLEVVDPLGVVDTEKSKALGNGVYTVNISAIEKGPFELRVSPADKQRSAGAAGTATASGKTNDPDLLLRPFTASITLGDAGVTAAAVRPPPAGSPPAPFAMVSQVKPLEVIIDWRPDWMKRVRTDQTIGGMRFGRTPVNGAQRVDVLVLHQTGTESVGSTIETLVFNQGSIVDAKDKQGNVIIDPATGQPKKKKNFAVAAHYIVDVSGHALKVVHEDNEAVHAEPGHWLDSVDVILNGRSIGIEIVHGEKNNEGSDPKKMHVFTDAQYETLLRIVSEIEKKFTLLTRQRVVGHCDVDLADERFFDPGILFEWHRFEDATPQLARKAVAANVAKPYGIEAGKRIDKTDKANVTLLQKDLKTIGYRMSDAAGVFGKDTQGAVRRFKRHWFSFRGGDKDQFVFPDENTVDFETAQRIIQVVLDGDTPAQPVAPVLKSLNVAPASGGAAPPVKTEKDAAAEEPGTAVFGDGEQVRVSWTIEGSPAGLRLDPGGHDVSGLTRDGKGSIVLPVRRAQSEEGFITFRLSAPSAATVAAAAPKTIADQQQAPAGPTNQPAPGALTQQAVVPHKIPPLPADPITRTKFLASVKDLDADVSLSKLPAREKAAVAALVAGNVPTFLRAFVPIDLTFTGPSGTAHTGRIFVSPDFLTIGTDADFIRWPMTPLGAQQVLDAFDCIFVTTKVSDAIFKAKGCKQLTMHSHTEWVKDPDPKKTFGFLMQANAQYDEMNTRCSTDVGTPGTLAAGHKKDVILHKFVEAKDKPLAGLRPVIIYGCKFQGTFPFQDPFPGHHPDTYEDYSHGIRLMSRGMLVDGNPKPVVEVLRDKELFGLLTGASIFEASENTFDPNYPLRYPKAPAPKPGQKLTLQLIDADGKPRPGVPYKLTVGSAVSEKQTDAGGAIAEDVAEGSGKGTLEVDGQVIELDIGGLAPVTVLAGVQARLNNLGFFTGAVTGEMNADTREALLRFQATHKLDRTGTVTPETEGALTKLYEG